MKETERRINIAVSGGPCTGKTTLAEVLANCLKKDGYDYDLIGEEYRRLKNKFGQFKEPVERCYMWMKQEELELNSNAKDGFVTDTPLFHLCISASLYSTTSKDEMVVEELLRRSIEATRRYGIIALADNPREFKYVNDQIRPLGAERSTRRHLLMRAFIESYFPEKLVLVKGPPEDRAKQVAVELDKLRISMVPQHHQPQSS